MTIFKYFNTRLFFWLFHPNIHFGDWTTEPESPQLSRVREPSLPVFVTFAHRVALLAPSFLIRRKYTIIRGSSNFKKNSPALLALLHELAWEANQTRSEWELIFHWYTTQWRCYWIYVTYKGIGTRPFKKDRVYLKNNTIIQNGCQLVVHQNNT